MSHRVISLVFLLGCAAAVVVFSLKPPRAQARLAATDSVIQQTLRGQNASRLFFRPAADTELYVWCRYLVAPRVLVADTAGAGDTVLYVYKDDGTPSDLVPSNVLADNWLDSLRAILYVAR